MAEFDSPWKESLEVYFESFLELCFPAVHREIDWKKGYLPLDKELQKLSPQGETGRRIVDKLMRVWRIAGDEQWILVHIEVQSQRAADISRRIDRKSVVEGKSVDLGGRRIIKKKTIEEIVHFVTAY